LLEQLHVRKLTAKLPIVFHTRSSKPLTHLWEDTQNIFKKTDVPLEKSHPHCLRATFCTTLFREGWGLPDVMHVMGHKDRHSSPLGHAENARRPDFALFQD
jgi:site-specific recombinase XerD